jgi:anti-sigma B factor antagonist
MERLFTSVRATKTSEDRVELTFPSDGVALIELAGEHDLGLYGPIGEALRLAAARRRHLLVDLSRCEFFDSTVVSLLLAAREDVEASGGELDLVVPPPPSAVARTAELMGLGELFPIHPTLVSALARGRHMTSIREVRAEAAVREGFVAECSCGWSGNHRTGVLAMHRTSDDAAAHSGAGNTVRPSAGS